jgi:hypothetical protein
MRLAYSTMTYHSGTAQWCTRTCYASTELVVHSAIVVYFDTETNIHAVLLLLTDTGWRAP